MLSLSAQKIPADTIRINRDEYTSRFHPIWHICRHALFIETVTESPDRIGVTRETVFRTVSAGRSQPAFACVLLCSSTRSAYCFLLHCFVTVVPIIPPKQSLSSGKSEVSALCLRKSLVNIQILQDLRQAPQKVPKLIRHIVLRSDRVCLSFHDKGELP